MARPPVNIARSVKDRLLNIARKEGRAFDVLLVRFALERLLYRLSVYRQGAAHQSATRVAPPLRRVFAIRNAKAGTVREAPAPAPMPLFGGGAKRRFGIGSLCFGLLLHAPQVFARPTRAAPLPPSASAARWETSRYRSETARRSAPCPASSCRRCGGRHRRTRLQTQLGRYSPW